MMSMVMVMIMATKKKNTPTTNILRQVIVVAMFFSLSHAQALEVIDFHAGSLQTFVDVRRGSFSIFDKDQKDIDFTSLLFGGATNPNSYFTVTVDGNTQTLDQMQVRHPFSITLGSQVDGTFYAGKDVLVEVAFFSLDLLHTGDFDSVGVVLKLSNTSHANRNVKVDFVLDTDIGESLNKSLIYLPSGESIIHSRVFENTPNFVFFGEGDILANSFNRKGFYLYPYVSDTLPSYMVVANWRRIFERQNIANGEPFSHEVSLIKDIGMGLRFGEMQLKSKDVVCVGFVISKQQSIVSPVLSKESISKGVFNEDRFKLEALLNKASESEVIIPDKKQERVRPPLPDYIPSDSMWGYLYRLNVDMKHSGNIIDSSLNPDYSSENRGVFFKK